MERDDRPWGYYQVVDEGRSFRVKRLCVRAGQRISYQRHTSRAEHWYLVAGSGVATIDGTDLQVEAGSTVDVPIGAAHRIANTGEDELVLVEVQTGSYFGEDDIERLSDDYGRPAVADPPSPG
ncbi:MAG: phosphomannose isomerase type II C-terminal cupin domain [Nocardioidaceae bacterium]